MKIQAVREGESVPLPALSGGGWVRQRVPVDGVVVSDGDETVFIPETKMREALRELEARRQAA